MDYEVAKTKGGGEGVFLIEEIDKKKIDPPELTDYNSWIRWRKASGTRPARALEDEGSTPPMIESRWYKKVMEHLYGSDWAEKLLIKQANEGEEEEGD